jgi:hypothetical protein
MKKIFLMVTLVMVAFSFTYADIYVKNVNTTKPFEIMGKKQEGTVEIEELWLGKEKFAVISKEFKVVGDFNKKKLFFIIPKLKQYYTFPIDIDKAKLKELLPQKIVEAITSIQITDANVKFPGEIKKISNWTCKSSELEMVFMIPIANIMPKIKIKMWHTNEVPFDYNSYAKGMGDFLKDFFTRIIKIDDNSQKELERLSKITGICMAKEVVVGFMGTEIQIETRCIEAAEKNAPEGIYEVPEDFAEKTIPGNLK